MGFALWQEYGDYIGRKEVQEKVVVGVQTGIESNLDWVIGSGNSDKQTDLRVYLEGKIDG